MNAYVVNLKNRAVSTYSNFEFNSATEGYAAGHDGLYALGANDDNGQVITARFRTPRAAWGELRRKLVDCLFVAMLGGQQTTVTVRTREAQHTYSAAVRPNGVTKIAIGRGIRDNYLSFELSVASRDEVRIDALEILDKASARRRT